MAEAELEIPHEELDPENGVSDFDREPLPPPGPPPDPVPVPSGRHEINPDRDVQPSPPKEPPELPPLRNGHDVLEEIQHCFYRQELVARRIGVARKELDGGRDPETGEMVSGVTLEYESQMEAVERELWAEHKAHKGEEGKGSKARWPGESTRIALGKEAMDEELIVRYTALRGEVKNLESYQRILDSQMEGLRSLLSWYKEEMRFAGGGAQMPDWNTAPPTPPAL